MYSAERDFVDSRIAGRFALGSFGLRNTRLARNEQQTSAEPESRRGALQSFPPLRSTIRFVRLEARAKPPPPNSSNVGCSRASFRHIPGDYLPRSSSFGTSFRRGGRSCQTDWTQLPARE